MRFYWKFRGLLNPTIGSTGVCFELLESLPLLSLRYRTVGPVNEYIFEIQSILWIVDLLVPLKCFRAGLT